MFPLRKLAGFGSSDTVEAVRERDLLRDLANRHADLDDVSPKRSRLRDVEKTLARKDCDLVHFAGHGTFDPNEADASTIQLEDNPLRPENLRGAVEAKIRARRPLVFLNTCRAGRQGWSLTGLGGWVQAWVRRNRCGALLAPQWIVDDREAHLLARVFYEQLEQGLPLGEAARQARRAVRDDGSGRLTWLALAVYGHPHALVRFGATPVGGGSPSPTQR